MNLFFWVWFFLVFIFLGIPKNAWAEPSCHLHVRVHSLGTTSDEKCSLVNLIYLNLFKDHFFDGGIWVSPQSAVQPSQSCMALVIFVKYACKWQTIAALRIESFPCNHSINAVLIGFNSTRQRIQVKFKAKIVKLWQKSYLNAISTRKTRKLTVFTRSICIYIMKPCRIC